MYVSEVFGRFCGFWRKLFSGGLCLEDKLGGGMWHFVVKGDTIGAVWKLLRI
jgi:hypothetical protein